MVLWNPFEELGGNTEEELRDAKLILWRGHCSVHGRFKPWHVEQIRKAAPDIKVLVHPECMREVVDISDLNGSTSFIINTVANSPSGSKWAIGTELNLVSAAAKTISRQRHSPARARPLYVRDDVSHRAAKSGLGDGQSRRRTRRQSN
jgi:quinolinate synthase